MSDDNFLSRWSRLKRRSEAGLDRPPDKDARGQALADAVPAQAGNLSSPIDAAPSASITREEPAPLPPVESLTTQSDFTPFMKAEVDPGTRRQALKTLFQDPRYNVMDGLDVYIDDYSKPDPLPQGWLAKLNQVARLGEYRDPEEKESKPAREGEPGESAEQPAPDQISHENEPVAPGPQGLDGPQSAVPESSAQNPVPPPGT